VDRIIFITLAASFMHGRVTAGCYERMGVTDPVAHDHDEYVAKALRCAQDPAWRQAIGQQLSERCGVLFENTAVMADVMAFFQSAVQAAGQGKTLPTQKWPPKVRQSTTYRQCGATHARPGQAARYACAAKPGLRNRGPMG
jgi:hypothetical protein